MQQNMSYGYLPQNINLCPTQPNAVNINIYSPQAYGANSGVAPQQVSYPLSQGMNTYPQQSFYPMNNGMNAYSQYPANYNNMFYNANMNPYPNSAPNQSEDKTSKSTEEGEKTPITNEYVQTLENYLNDQNSKIRLIGVRELMDRLKEDPTRKDNPSLVPLLNKALRDSSPSVRFIALTALQLGYCAGNNETVSILKDIQKNNKNKVAEEGILASDALLKMVSRQ